METYTHRDRCAIAGIGSTEFSNDSGRSVLCLATEASTKAVSDAGLRLDEIDGIVRSDFDAVTANDLANALGLQDLRFWSSHGPGGAAPSLMVASAIGAILSGQATNVLAFRSLNGRSGFRLGRGRGQKQAGSVGGDGTYEEFFAPYGMVAPGQMWATLARRHMHEYGTTQEQLGSIATTIRAAANANPHAQLSHKPLTLDDYMAGPMISSPLRLFDFCLETDGACAVVITSSQRARQLARRPVVIAGVGMGATPGVQGGLAGPVLMRPEPLRMPAESAAKALYRNAGLGPDDIDVAQLYDCFTITVLVQLEAYGFCPIGEGGAFAESGAIAKGGRLPINTAGGNLSEGYLHGMSHVLEGVRQIRGESTSQVPDARTCLVTSGLPNITGAMILRGD